MLTARLLTLTLAVVPAVVAEASPLGPPPAGPRRLLDDAPATSVHAAAGSPAVEVGGELPWGPLLVNASLASIESGAMRPELGLQWPLSVAGRFALAPRLAAAYGFARDRLVDGRPADSSLEAVAGLTAAIAMGRSVTLFADGGALALHPLDAKVKLRAIATAVAGVCLGLGEGAWMAAHLGAFLSPARTTPGFGLAVGVEL